MIGRAMLRFMPSGPGERLRMRAIKALFIRHGVERTPEGRSLLLLRDWLSPTQQVQFAKKGYFEVVGGETGKQYRIFAGTVTNVCEIDEKGELPIGDVMLAQKIALESCESSALVVAREFIPNGFAFRRSRLLG